MTPEQAALTQAVSTVFLIVIIVFHIRRTGHMLQSYRQQIGSEGKLRRVIAFEAIKSELMEIIRCCPEPGKDKPPAVLPTTVWDTMRGELAYLGNSMNTALSILYAEVRRCNTECLKHIAAALPSGEGEHYFTWNKAALRVIRRAKETYNTLLENKGGVVTKT